MYSFSATSSAMVYQTVRHIITAVSNVLASPSVLRPITTPPPCFPFCSSGPSSPHHHHHTTARTVYTTAPPPTRKPRPPRPASCARRTSTSRSAQKGLCIKIVTSIYNSEQIFPGLTATSESKAGRHMLLLALLENIDKPLTEPRCDISCFVT